MSRCETLAHAGSVQRGFTLIEMIVALALVAMISAAVFESLRFGQRTYGKVVGDGGTSWEIFASQRVVRNILEGAYPKEPSTAGESAPGLRGDRESVEITAAAPLAVDGAGLLRYELSVRRTSVRGNDMVVLWRAEPAGSSGASSEEVLIGNIAYAQWSYQAQPHAGDIGQIAWLDKWTDTYSLPALIRLRIGFHDGDSRRWPDLIVAPRITNDANCIFDAVAQRCRARS